MLFDLRSAGRRRTIKVVYVTLAFLMGGGLVFFGIGGDVSGGLVDAITERGSGGGDNSDALRKKEQDAARRTRANPRNERAWTDLARARFQAASAGDGYDQAKQAYTDAGRAKLGQAGQAWERYLALDPKKPDDRIARLMVQAYAETGDLVKATRAQEIVADVVDTGPAYVNLAVLAYQAGQDRIGDLARGKALDKTPKDQRESIKGQIDDAKTQAQLQRAQQGAQGGQPGGDQR